MSKSVFIVLIISLSVKIWACNNNITVAEEQAEASDTSKINKLIDQGNSFLKSDPDKTLEYANAALKLAEKSGWKEGQANAMKLIGTGYYYKGDYENALSFYNQSLKIYKDRGNKLEIAKLTGNIGAVYRARSEYSKALEYYEAALKVADEANDLVGISIYSGNIGIVYESTSDYPKALEYFEKALKSAEAINDKIEIRRNLSNIGMIYHDMSDYSKALEYYKRALDLAEKLHDKQGSGYCLTNIGIIYWKLKDFQDALSCYEKALKIAEELSDKSSIGRIMGNSGIVFAEMSDYSKALEYYNKALKIAEETGDKSGIGTRLGNIGTLYQRMAVDSINKPGKTQREAYLNKSVDYLLKALNLLKEIKDASFRYNYLSSLSESYIELGDYKKAFETYRDSQKLHDSIFSSENQKKIAGMEAKLENELKQKEIEILQQKNLIQELDISRQKQTMALMNSKQELQYLELEQQDKDMSILQKDKELTLFELKQKNLEGEQKDKEVIILGKEKAYQSMVSRSLAGGLVFTGITIILLILFFQRKRKDNRILAEKNLLIEQTNTELSEMNQNLTEKNIKIGKQKEQIEQSHSIIQEGIDQAKEYVLSLLPKKISEGRIQADWLFFPSSQLGGDVFGYHQIDSDHFAFYILDVCGHGIGAALHSVAILHFIRSGSKLNVDPGKPELVIESLNNTFQSDDHNGLFFTMWYGVMNIKERMLNYVCAGHPAPLMLYEDGTAKLLDPPAMSVGCIPEIKYKTQSVHVTDKAKLFLFSDGVYEINKPNGKKLLVDEFYDIIRQNGSNDTGLNEIFDVVAGIQNSRVFEDDFSIIKIKLEL